MNKYILIIAILLLGLIHFTAKAQLDNKDFGIALAGCEWGMHPTNSDIDYFASKGMKLVRLPISWERIQPALNGELNTAEINKIKSIVNYAKTKNVKVLIDLHNYCRRKVNGVEKIIGSPEVPLVSIKDVWARLADQFKTFTNIWGYGLMNEPHDMQQGPLPWFNIAQSLIDTIRVNDAVTPIVVGGDGWSGSFDWVKNCDKLKNLTDPSAKIIFEAHSYWDIEGSSGSYSKSDALKTNAYRGVDRVKPFVEWLKKNNKQGFVGEYGIPANDPAWALILENFLKYLAENCVNGTYWAAGSGWPKDYDIGVQPQAGVDKPQMASITKYLTTNGNCGLIDTICPKVIIPKVKINRDDWSQTTNIIIKSGDSIVIAPQLIAEGKWNWKGPYDFQDTMRVISINAIQPDQFGKYTITYTNICNDQTNVVITICSSAEIKPFVIIDSVRSETTEITVNQGTEIMFDPEPNTTGSWFWSGMGIESSTRMLKFSPTIGGTLTATYTTDCGESTTKQFKVSVPNGGYPVPGTIQAEDFYTMSGIQTETTSDEGGGINVGWIDNNDWMEYQIIVPADGKYKVSYRVASQSAGGRVAISSNGIRLTTINIPNTGAWQNWSTVTTLVDLKAGSQIIRLTALSGAWNINWFKIETDNSVGISESRIADKSIKI